MRKVLIPVLVCIAVFWVALALAAPPVEGFNWGDEINPGNCSGGELVINVNHQVVNALDSGTGGNWWATTEYKRHIQVWQIDETTFCALVQYNGSFVTTEGRSPNYSATGGTVSAGIKGTFQGGYRATITGTLSPNMKTKGSLGTFDYGCDPTQACCNHAVACASLFNWLDEYFAPGWGFAYEWWGWVYHAGKYGTWVNSSEGNQGDISD